MASAASARLWWRRAKPSDAGEFNLDNSFLAAFIGFQADHLKDHATCTGFINATSQERIVCEGIAEAFDLQEGGEGLGGVKMAELTFERDHLLLPR